MTPLPASLTGFQRLCTLKQWLNLFASLNSVSSATSLPALAVCQQPEPGSEGAGVRLRPGSGTLSWTGEDGAGPHQHRAALMKVKAAGMAPGYADHGLIGLMRCSSSWVRSGTVGWSRTKQGGELSNMGQKEEETSITAWVCWVFLKLKIYPSCVEISCSGHSNWLKLSKGKHINVYLDKTTLKLGIYHNTKNFISLCQSLDYLAGGLGL